MTTTQTKLKIIPGRGLTGKDIKNRLRNKTLEGQTFGKESYTLDEQMTSFTKLSKTEQINAARKTSMEIKKLQNQLEEANTKAKQRMEEQEIERRVQEKMKEIAKEQINNNNTNQQK